MATTPILARQYPLLAVADISVDSNHLVANAATIQIPVNGYVVRVFGELVTPFTGGSDIVLTVSDGTTTFVSSFDLDAGSAGALVTIQSNADQKFYASGGTISIYTGGTTPTAGRVLVGVEYAILNRSNEVQTA